MKLWRVDFLSYAIIRIIFLYNFIPVFGQIKVENSLFTQDLDILTYYYQQSDMDTLSMSKRLEYISSFLKGALLTKQDSLVYMGLMRKTKLLNKAKQYDSAIVYSHQLYDLAKKKRDTLYIGYSLTKLGIYHKSNNQLVKAFKYHTKAFKMYKTINDSLIAGRSLLYMANIQTSLGDYSGSKTTAIDGVTYLEHTDDLRSLVGFHHIISVANRMQKNYKEALRYNEKALSLGKDSLSISIIRLKNILMLKNTKALILANQGNYREAITILEILKKDKIVQQDKSEYARVLGNLGYVQWLRNRENENSEELLIKALEIQKEINDVLGSITNNIYLTKYYFERNKDKALQHAEAAYYNAKKQHSLAQLLESLGFIFKLRENTKEEAIEYDRIHKELEEANQNNREIYAVTRYENDKLTNENLILKAETARKERQKIIYLFSTLFLLLSGVVVFYFFKQRYKREKIREVYNAETRISKKLHDELANDVYHVMIQMQNNNTDTQKMLDKLEGIYKSTRDISREHNSFKTGKEYGVELNNMLSSYSSNDTKIIIKDINEINWQSINPEKKIIVHRSLQELMTNMKKHSQAELVAITFKKMAKNITITYADNGVGVSAEEIIYSNGLQNTENRIKTIGGSFIFDSEKGKGFKAKIHFPS